ncbi:Small membrane A-kinase anchor [Solea senegalensis]|uniref:Small membrane A-kinase anchor n=1 Tax=Solea senegalensis TaxID=28829 RepID=A0AAV6RHH8_SOLSE|nr:Small membrane A-kinase anchor [Solea senegalensis]
MYLLGVQGGPAAHRRGHGNDHQSVAKILTIPPEHKRREDVVVYREGGDETTVFLEEKLEQEIEELREIQCFVRPEETTEDICLPVSQPLLDFAQKMSEDIVAQALQLFWEVEIQYNSLPFIDNDTDYVA